MKEKIRIAIHSKEEWFRYVKKENQRYYTYFGNAIPILECMLKYADEFGVSLIITDSVYKLSDKKYSLRLLNRIRIKGISQTFRLIELVYDENIKEDDKFYDYFHAGLKLYENKNWNEAGTYFKQCLKYNANDVPSKKLLTNCKNLIANPPYDNWDPVYDMD